MMKLDVLPTIRLLLQENIEKGDTVVDATMGKGHDTLFLARLVGEQGQVIAFDIQKSALDHTAKRLQEAGITWAQLYKVSHTQVTKYVKKAQAFVYNLGYLPGGNKDLTTQSDETLLSVQKALSLLLPGGLIALVCYPGHPEGKKEAQALENYLSLLKQPDFEVLRLSFINHNKNAPYALVVQKDVHFMDEGFSFKRKDKQN